VNSTDCTKMSRIEAWNFMKKLIDGTATIVVRQRLDAKGSPMTKRVVSSAASSASVSVSAVASTSTSVSGKLEEAGPKVERNKEETKQI
jgi:hypothetical protein